MTELDEINEILNKSRSFYEKGLAIMNEGNKLIHDGIYKYPNDASLRLALAAQMASTGNFHDAIDLYRTILQINPNEPYAITGLGIIYFEIGKFHESFKLAQASLSIRDMPETKILLCRHYLSQGKLIEVKKILAEILRVDSNNPQAILLKQRLEHINAGDDQSENF
jgi:tetratricopeptide (TPR) repeat protein